MNIYRLTVNSDNGFQVITDSPPRELLYKDLYSKYKFNQLNCLRLDLDKGKKITDILSVGTIGFTGFPIKNKAHEILKGCNLCEIQFVEILDKDLRDYKFMFFNSDLSYKLDYEKSNFKLVENILGEITELDINVPKNRNGVIKVYDEYCVEDIFNQLIPHNGYHFISNFKIYNYDVFRIGDFDKSFYVSEKVKELFEENKISGVEFTLAEDFNF